METFAQKYPAFASLLQLAATVAQDVAAGGQTLIQKLESLTNVVSPVVAFLPQASLLGAEITALKASPADMEAAAEALVTDLAFTSSKAKSIVEAAFPVAEGIVAQIKPIEALFTAIKA